MQEFNRNNGLSPFLSANFDWLEFTVFKESLHNIFVNILQLDRAEFQPLAKGRFGYNRQLKWQQGVLFILYNACCQGEPLSHDKNGIHIIMTGQGCRAFECNRSIRQLFYRVLLSSGANKFTRIDLAIDDKQDKLLQFNRFLTELEAGNVSAKWKTWELLLSRTLGDNQFKGRTIYLGKQTSAIFCRIYDKQLERLAKNHVRIEPETLKWTRLELVFRKKKAELLAHHLLEVEQSLGQLILSVLNQYIRFLSPNPNNQRKRSWETADWWDSLLHNVDKLPLRKEVTERTIEEFETWIDQQIGPTLAAILTAKEGEVDWLYHIIHNASGRLKQKHLDAIQLYRLQHGRRE